jgi:oxalate---CoA ligase
MKFDEKHGTIGEIIGYNAKVSSSRVAIIGPSIGAISYGDLANHISRCRFEFDRCGISPGSRIGVVMPAGPEAAIATIAASCHAACVPLNPSLPKDEMLREFKNFALDALILADWPGSPGSEMANDFGGSLFQVSRGGAACSGFDIDCVRQAPLSFRSAASPSIDEHVAMVLRTSATTGPAKLVPVTHGNIVEMASKMRKWLGLSEKDRAACTLPTYYAQGCKTTLLVPLILGGSIAVPELEGLEGVFRCLSDLAPTWLSAGPTLLHGLLDATGAHRNAFCDHSLRYILCSSAALGAQVRDDVEAVFGVPVLEFYGLSEAGMMAANPPPPQRRKPGTAGRFSPGELEIRDQTSESLVRHGKCGRLGNGGMDRAAAVGPKPEPYLWPECHSYRGGPGRGLTIRTLADLKRDTKVSDGLAPGGGRHHFFAAISLSIALSNSASANSFFSLAFSSSSARSRLASDTSRPPYLAFHL